MKRRTHLFALMATVAMFCACGNADNGTDVETVTEPETPYEATVIPVTKYYSQQEFLSLFVGHTWRECAVYDVYANGEISKEILSVIDGYAPMEMTVCDDSLINVGIHYYDPPTIPDYQGTIIYRYQQGNKLLFTDNTHIESCYQQPLTVIEINDSTMTCLGQVFVPKWAPDAVNGLFVFRRSSAK